MKEYPEICTILILGGDNEDGQVYPAYGSSKEQNGLFYFHSKSRIDAIIRYLKGKGINTGKYKFKH